jgi:hypothetical protein
MRLPMPLRLIASLIAIACVTTALPVRAEVSSQSTGGFVVRHQVTLPVEAPTAYTRFLALSDWWDPAHSYSGDALNLLIEPRVGGCWCERLPPEGMVEHLRLTMIRPNAALRFSGGLGPLAAMGAGGAMSVNFVPMADGLSRVELTYAVSGHLPGEAGMGAMAGPVDGVLGAAMARYAAEVAQAHEEAVGDE